jgi:hypothetical protein
LRDHRALANLPHVAELLGVQQVLDGLHGGHIARCSLRSIWHQWSVMQVFRSSGASIE